MANSISTSSSSFGSGIAHFFESILSGLSKLVSSIASVFFGSKSSHTDTAKPISQRNVKTSPDLPPPLPSFSSSSRRSHAVHQATGSILRPPTTQAPLNSVIATSASAGQTSSPRKSQAPAASVYTEAQDNTDILNQAFLGLADLNKEIAGVETDLGFQDFYIQIGRLLDVVEKHKGEKHIKKLEEGVLKFKAKLDAKYESFEAQRGLDIYSSTDIESAPPTPVVPRKSANQRSSVKRGAPAVTPQEAPATPNQLQIIKFSGQGDLRALLNGKIKAASANDRIKIRSDIQLLKGKYPAYVGILQAAERQLAQ